MKKIFALTLTMMFVTSIIDAKVVVPPLYGEPGYVAPVEDAVVVNPYAKHMKNVIKKVKPEKVHARNLEAAEIKRAALAPVVAPVRVAEPVVVAPVRREVVEPVHVVAPRRAVVERPVVAPVRTVYRRPRPVAVRRPVVVDPYARAAYPRY